MQDPGSVSLGTELQSCNILAVTSKPHQHRAGSSTLVDIFLAAVISQVAPRPFLNRALTHGQPRANTPWALKGLISINFILCFK